MKVRSIEPSIALPGGQIRINVEGLSEPQELTVEFGGVPASLMGVSSDTVTVRVPRDAGQDVELRGRTSCRAKLKVGRLLAAELHPVGNPVVDTHGSVFVTFSGARGERVPFGVFKVDREGQKEPFLADILNPTGLAIGPDNCLYVSSRQTGTTYRSTFDKQVEKYVDELGLACGLVFDAQGNLFVGDRGGVIFKVSAAMEVEPFCRLEPSISAYHLAMGPDECLYVTGPTLSTQDSVYRIRPDGSQEIFYRGFGRPQGLAFDPQGKLQVAASYRGKKGIFTLSNGTPEWSVSGPMLVGLAYSPDGRHLYLVDNANLYQVDL